MTALAARHLGTCSRWTHPYPPPIVRCSMKHVQQSLHNDYRLTSRRHFSALASSASSSPTLYDICIVGGGLVGATLALCLQSSPITRGLSIAVIEPAPPITKITQTPTPHSPPGVRVISLTPSSHDLYHRLGVLQSLPSSRITAFDSMLVYESVGKGHVHWKAREIGRTALGYIVENDLLLQAIYQAIQHNQQQHDTQQQGTQQQQVEQASQTDNNPSTAGVTIMSGVKVNQLSPATQSSLPCLSLSDSRVLSCRLLVGSDGANSIVKTVSSDHSSIGWEYQQQAVVASLKLAQPHTTAWQRFLPSGPLACLPCHDQYSSIVWSTSPAHAKHLCSMPTQQFLADVNAAFTQDIAQIGEAPSVDADSLFSASSPFSMSPVWPVLFPFPSPSVPPSVVELCSNRLSFPLRLRDVREYVSTRVALIGDAAHVIHPLAGQGVNLGIADAECLTRHLTKAVSLGMDCGSTVNVLHPYANERRPVNTRMMLGVDAIQRIFSVPKGPFATLRNAGLHAFNAVSALKYAAANEAMGLHTTAAEGR